MPDPDPSDPSGAQPFNRVRRLIDAWAMLFTPPSIRGSGGVAVDLLHRPEAVDDVVPELTRAEYGLPPMAWERVYHEYYALVRLELKAGRDHAAIRAKLSALIESHCELPSAARAAIEDALANRPMGGENPTGP